MPTTLTLENIPDEVYHRLEACASANQRSLNTEALVALKTGLAPARPSEEEFLRRAREMRESLPFVFSSAEEIDAFKREGRP